jgi:NAD(P)-dependent dehydrogenase (short-subunit alcohol dehydrogenase family)
MSARGDMSAATCIRSARSRRHELGTGIAPWRSDREADGSSMVNSTGILKMLPLSTSNEQDFDDTFATNVPGTFNVLRQAARRLSDGSRIVTLSSSAPGIRPLRGSKAAVEVLTRTLANELADDRSTSTPWLPAQLPRSSFLKESRRSRSIASHTCHRWNLSGRPRTSRTWCRSSQPRRWLGQWTGAARQWRVRLNERMQ